MRDPRTFSRRNDFDPNQEPLHACIQDGNILRLQQLLQSSPAPDLKLQYFQVGTPLHLAAELGDVEAVNLLLEAGADPRSLCSRNDTGFTPLGFAAIAGHVDVTERIWRSRSPEAHIDGINPWHAGLTVAARYGRADVIEALLNAWDGWPREIRGMSLLHASQQWHLNVARLLMQRASFDKTELQQALHAAVDYKVVLSDILPKRDGGIDYFHQRLLVGLLVDAGADPSVPSRDNIPPVCTAAAYSDLTGPLETLLQKGADPNGANAAGWTPLHILSHPMLRSFPGSRASFLNETAIRIVLDFGGSIVQPNREGDTPLQLAAQGSDSRMFRLYLSSVESSQQDELLRLKNPFGETLLHFAAAGARTDIIEYLISRGLEVNARSCNGWTPLMCALVPTRCSSSMLCLEKNLLEAVESARLLIHHGADPRAATDEGWTALHCLSLHADQDRSMAAERLTRDLIASGVDPKACATLLTHERGYYSFLPWGHRLSDAMTAPSEAGLMVQPDLPPSFWAAERGAAGVIRGLLAESTGGVLDSDDRGRSVTKAAILSPILNKRPELREIVVQLLVEAGAAI